MDAVLPPQLFPAELIAAIVRHAHADAVDAAEFLRRLGTPPSPNTSWPAEYLLAIGLAVRLQRWGTHRLTFHRDAALPSPEEVLMRLTTESDPVALNAWLKSAWISVIGILRHSFAWVEPDHGLGAEIAMLVMADDPFLDKIVDLLWDVSRQQKLC